MADTHDEMMMDAGSPKMHDAESEEARRQREEQESLELARALMAEEAMASYAQHFQIIRDSNQLSEEDQEAWRAALQEEEREQVEEFEDEDGNMSYDAMLQLGERIGDVKTERWTMIAQREISKLLTFVFDASAAVDESNKDDSEHKCLVCQCEYENNETLRRLPCGHCFHRECCDNWLRTKDFCPYCRQSIV